MLSLLEAMHLISDWFHLFVWSIYRCDLWPQLAMVSKILCYPKMKFHPYLLHLLIRNLNNFLLHQASFSVISSKISIGSCENYSLSNFFLAHNDSPLNMWNHFQISIYSTHQLIDSSLHFMTTEVLKNPKIFYPLKWTFELHGRFDSYCFL